MLIRESPYAFGTHQPILPFTQPSPRVQPGDDERNRTPLPTLPPMSYLLHGQQRYEQNQQLSPTIPAAPPNHMQHHPLWHSEQNPEAPPHHIYHPPQNLNAHATQNRPEPMLVRNSHVMAVPVTYTAAAPQRRQIKKITHRRDDDLKDSVESHRAASVIEARYEPPKGDVTEEEARPNLHRQGSTHSEAPSSRSRAQYQNLNTTSTLGSSSGAPSPTLNRTPPAKYSIRMRQQPIAARACGFGERDRRVIDPPPILQMKIDSETSSPEQLTSMIRNPFTVVHVILWDPILDKDDTAMPGTSDKRQQRRLMGTLVASPFVGKDENDVEGCFFTFPDLSVRTPGQYTLRFSLVVLDPTEMRAGFSAPIRSVAMSSTFTVYNAKDFCGMRASTELTKRLKHQGCLISVKKGNTKSNGWNRGGDDDDDDDEDDEDVDVKRKRSKH